MSSSDSVRVGGARRGRAQLGPRRHDVDGTAPDVAPAPQPDGDAVGRKVALAGPERLSHAVLQLFYRGTGLRHHCRRTRTAPLLLVCVLLARPAARLSMTAPPRRLIAGGLAAMGLAMSMTALVRPGMPYRPLVVPMALFGFGFLLAQAAWNNAFLSALPAAHVGVSAGVSKAAAQTGTLLRTALQPRRTSDQRRATILPGHARRTA